MQESTGVDDEEEEDLVNVNWRKRKTEDDATERVTRKRTVVKSCMFVL